MDDAALAGLLGEPAEATAHLTGVPTARGAAAVDGDIATSWITPFGAPVGQALHLGLDGTAGSIAITQPTGTFSPITRVRITDPAGSFDVDVDAGRAGSEVALPRTIDLSDATIEILAVDERTTVDRRFGEAIVLPAAISEITFDGASPGVTPGGDHVEDCRDDLLQVDGNPVGLSFTASTEAILRGEPIDAGLCAADGSTVLPLDTGTHLVASTPGSTSGFHVDQVVLAEPDAGAPADATPAPTVTVTSTSRTGRTVEVSPCPQGCWVVLGEGYNPAWTASDDLGIARCTDPRRRQCQRVVHRTDGSTDHGHVPLDRTADPEHRPRRLARRGARLPRPRHRRSSPRRRRARCPRRGHGRSPRRDGVTTWWPSRP